MANSKKQVMKKLLEYRRNMCMTCKHNETCNSPLHGHVTPERNSLVIFPKRSPLLMFRKKASLQHLLRGMGID